MRELRLPKELRANWFTAFLLLAEQVADLIEEDGGPSMEREFIRVIMHSRYRRYYHAGINIWRRNQSTKNNSNNSLS